MKIRAKIKFFQILDIVFCIIIFILLFSILTLLFSYFCFYVLDIHPDILSNSIKNNKIINIIYWIALLIISSFILVTLDDNHILDTGNLATDFFFKRRYIFLCEELKEIIAIKEAKENLEITRRAKELHEILSEEQRIKESMKPTQQQKPPQESEGNTTQPESFKEDILSPEDDDTPSPKKQRPEEPEEPHYDSEADRLKDIIRKRTE